MRGQKSEPGPEKAHQILDMQIVMHLCIYVYMYMLMDGFMNVCFLVSHIHISAESKQILGNLTVMLIECKSVCQGIVT